MRDSILVAWRWLSVALAFVPAFNAAAASIKGRVVDSAGSAVAEAEVRIWQKLPTADGRGAVNQQVLFHGGNPLRTDAEGRFATPDVFDERTPVRIVAQAVGMLAGRTAWILPDQQVTGIDDIVLRRLRSVQGRVVDRQGAALAGTTVFNSGDGHAGVETQTDAAGRFKLDGVPEGTIFLFAEKPGYRFTGIVHARDDEDQIMLARDDENVEPIAPVVPTISDTESADIGRRLLEPYLQGVIERGSEADRVHCQHALAEVDPQRALNLAAAVAGHSGSQLDNDQFSGILAWIHRQPVDGWEEIAALIEAQPDQWNAARLYLACVDMLNDAKRERKLEWLALSLAHARQVSDPIHRAHFFGWLAVEFQKLAEHDRAAQILKEAEAIAEELPRENFDAMLAFERIAFAYCNVDFPSCIRWLDRIGHAGRYGYACGSIAAELATDRPAQAEQVWLRLLDRSDVRAIAGRANYLPQFFFRIVTVDRQRAERLADRFDDSAWRVRALGAISRGLADTDGASARSMLEKALAEARKGEWPSAEPHDPRVTAARSVAWLIPIAQHVAPEMASQILWRAVSLREPRPVIGRLDDETELADAELAKLLAPFNHEVARALIAPLVPRLSTFTHPPSDGQPLWELLTAAALINPRWAVELFGSLPDPPDLANSRPQNYSRMWLARFLAYPYQRRLLFLDYFDPQ